MTPYEEGYRAYFADLQVCDNPFTYGSREAGLWLDGFFTAFFDDESWGFDDLEKTNE